MTTTPASTEAKPSIAIWLQYLGAAAVWGSSFLFIKVSVGGLSPPQVVLGRLFFGALMLVLIMAISRRQWPRGLRVWGHLFAIGILMCVAPFLMFSWAAQYLPSGLSSIYNATTPIATMLVSLAILPDERLNRTKTIAILIAAGGIILVAAPWNISIINESPQFLLAQLACLGGTTCYGLGFSYTRRFIRGRNYDAITVSASQISAGALVMLLLTPFIGTDPINLDVSIVASILMLGGIGTGIAYIWYTNVINAWGASMASTVTYLTPLGGVMLGILILEERIEWNELLGGAIVIGAMLISQRKARTPRKQSRLNSPEATWAGEKMAQ